MRIRSRKTETVIYISIWTVAITLFLIDRLFNSAQDASNETGLNLAKDILLIFLPFLLLFLIHNYIALPLLLKNRYRHYIFSTLCLLGAFWGIMAINFSESDYPPPPGRNPPDARLQAAPPNPPHEKVNGRLDHPANPMSPSGAPRRPLLPLPLALDIIYSLLIIGVNLAVALIFQHYDDKLEREKLRKLNAENELTYLKAQINPHFYMNMLNNIHSMIDIDPEKAQTMLIDMSKLMRYMLYESGKTEIPLSDEIDFIRNYIGLMTMRIRRDKVNISTLYPDKAAMTGVAVPPLLFIVFIENAFKHGISYQDESVITVSFRLRDDGLSFLCMNSKPRLNNDERNHGIGLRNIRQRLKLLYGDTAELTITDSPTDYSVFLNIPIYKKQNDTQDTDNR